MAVANNGSDTNSDGLSDVKFAYAPAVPGVDLISDEVIAELSRRQKGFVGGGVTGAIVYGPTPPQDKSKLWDRGDGNLYRYDPATGEWITGNSDDEDIYPGVDPAGSNQLTDTSGLFFAQAYPRFISRVAEITSTGAQTIPVPISPALLNSDYVVVVEPGYENEAHWYITTHDADLCTVVYEDPGWVTSGDPLNPTAIRITIIEMMTADNFTA